jgi:hypothetical protein
MPPLWQYFVTLRKEADESIPDPKGRESRTPKPFPLQKGRFQGTTKGGQDADRGPLCLAFAYPPPTRKPLRPLD